MALQAIGSCFCGMRVALRGFHSPVLSAHGPRHNRCYGGGKAPVEVSTEAGDQFLREVLVPRVGELRNRIRDLFTGAVTEFDDPVHGVVGREHPSYQWLHARERRDAERQLHGLRDQIESIRERLAPWREREAVVAPTEEAMAAE